MAVTRQEAINEALARLRGIAFAMGSGFSEHGPMVAEAICSLGRNDRVTPWVESYKAHYRHNPAPPPQQAIDESDWHAALGNYARVSDWLDYFRGALAEQPWQAVIRTWLPRLMDGYAGGLTHGLIRTAHAVRALPNGATPSELERDELAHGLAYWAATYHRSVGDPDRHGARPLDEALQALPRGEGADIAPAIESLAATPDVDAAISRHTATFGRLLLAHGELAPIPTIQLVHTVTAPGSLRDLLPFLPVERAAWAYRQLWQVSAGIVARLAKPLAVGSETDPALAASRLTRDELIDRAIAHRDDHVIKLTDACLREDAIRPDPVYRVLAETMLQRLPAWQ
jgi:Questin oxidase-like